MLKPVYALVGGDLFLQLQKLSEIVAAAPSDVQRFDLEGESTELAEVLDELRSFSMFGSGKLVVVRSAGDFVSRFREQLENYLAKPSTSATLVLRLESLPSNQRIYKLIDKVGQVHDCKTPKDLKGWLAERARKHHNIHLAPEAARLLEDYVGADLGRLDNELAKLALQTDGGKVDAKDIAGTVSFQREQQMWDMTDQLARGNTTEALRRWRQLIQLDPSAEFRAVTWLVMWLEKVNKAVRMKRKGVPPFTICRELKVWPQEAQKPFLDQADAIGEAGAARLLERLARTDFQSKTGVGDMAENVERFILSVSVVR